jgi:formylglycine-generating enzyme required for sulfatase activity
MGMVQGKRKRSAAPRHLRIFLASPGDVAEERAIAREVIGRLPYDPLLRDRITVDLVAWDGPGGVPMEATLTPQEAIRRGLTRPSACDILVVILWSRLGTPLPTDWETRPDGSAYRSGTEWEYLDALRAAEQTGSPRILVYRRTEEPVFRPSDPAFLERYQQWQAVDAFFAELRDAARGYNSYESASLFAAQLEDHLKALVKAHLEDHPNGGEGAPRPDEPQAAMHAQLRGGGVIAQGQGAVAAGSRGAAVAGNASNTVIATGDGTRITQHFRGEEGEARTDPASLERAYLNRLLEQAGYLSLSGLDPAVSGDKDARLRLEAVYTALITKTFRQDLRKSEEANRLGYHHSALEMLDRERRLVLLGDPGSGKSTFVNFVVLCLAGERTGNRELNLDLLTAPLPDHDGEDREDPQDWHHGSLLPVRVILRDFATEGLPPVGEKATGDHLWRFIADGLGEALAEYRPLLRKELLEKGALILLDGLDEVPEAERRRVQVKQAVEGFAQGFPACRVLLTSRTYAYQKQDWRLPGFAETTLAPLHDGQIRRFVQRWYEHAAALGRFSADDARGRAALLESAIFARPQLRDLVERPLLLTLMASLHAWRGGTLPERRERLYADTVDLLLEFWEGRRVTYGPDGRPRLVQRSLAEYLKVGKAKVREVLEDLAFHAHAGQPDLEGTADIAEGELLRRLLALSERGAERPANTALLIHHLRDRAGILAARGVGIYTFPHRSFQEYLAACRLTGETFPDEVATLARQDPDRWHEVALLAAAKAARGVRSSVWSLADCLCFREPEDPDCSDADPWGARLAAEALVESADLGKVGDANRTKLARVRRWLVRLLGVDRFSARERALIGHHLALLGDPRPELMTVEAMQLCYIPPGPFRMGSGEDDEMAFDDERPLHEQAIDYGYWLARYPVTVAQFATFAEASGFAPADPDALQDDSNRPVRWVSWYQALAFGDWLTRRWRDQGRLPDAYRVTLPSEPEWEKAARGGLEIPATPLVGEAGMAPAAVTMLTNADPHRRYPWGREADPERASFVDSRIGDTSAVGAFPAGASPYGCEEMSGNVWEWTRSLWGEDASKPQFEYPYDPGDGRERLEASDAVRRLLRGGAFHNDVNDVRCAYRLHYEPDDRNGGIGFRVVLSPFL